MIRFRENKTLVVFPYFFFDNTSFYCRFNPYTSDPRIADRNVPFFLNECCFMDFVLDQLNKGKRFRALTILDLFNRECLEIYVDQSIKGDECH